MMMSMKHSAQTRRRGFCWKRQQYWSLLLLLCSMNLPADMRAGAEVDVGSGGVGGGELGYGFACVSTEGSREGNSHS